jgi:RimJ/RimL family protein N-acetyltransferase
MNTKILNTSIVLENESVKLIPFEDARHLELKEIIFDSEIWKFMGMYINTDDDFEKYIKSTLKQRQEGVCYPFLIIDKKTNRIAGSTRYGYINSVSQKCEIGWTWYGIDFQGTGLNKACKYELLKFGFETIGFKRIQFSADLENIRSQKAIKKLGATQEGVFRNNYIDSEGKSKTDVYFSIITDEWEEIKKGYFNNFS